MPKTIVAILGATGNQGGGLAHAILSDRDGGYAVRAITRTPNSEKSRALAAAGAEIVAADLNDPDSLKRAFRGADAAYCVTFFWEHFSTEKETMHGRSLARAAADAGVRHVIWSTFEDSRDSVPLEDRRMPTLQGRYKVPHFDAKADADDTFSELKLPVTFLLTSFYWDNMIFFGMGPKKGPDGRLAITFPLGDKPMPSIAASDIGACAYSIFKNGPEFIGKTVGVAGEHLTGARMAEDLTKALGQPVAYNAVTPDAYRALGFPGADDLGNMFQFKADFNSLYCGNRPLALSRRLNPKLQTFAQWLAVNKDRIPLG
jgi:uncharacterized protein YbjT (DUF2867 family)